MTTTGRRRPRAGGAGGRQAPTPGSAADDSPDADPAEVARTRVLRSLNAAPRTRAQLADLLASRGVPDGVALACLDRFEELRLIDDAEYARMWVRSRHEQRGLPRRTLAFELTRKGVGREDIDAALELIDDDDEFEAARVLAHRKAGATNGLAPHVRRRRLMGALLRRGYSTEVASRAVAEALTDEGDDDVGGW